MAECAMSAPKQFKGHQLRYHEGLPIFPGDEVDVQLKFDEAPEHKYAPLRLLITQSSTTKTTNSIILFHGSLCSRSKKRDPMFEKFKEGRHCYVRIDVSAIPPQPLGHCKLKSGKIYLDFQDENYEFQKECWRLLIAQVVRRFPQLGDFTKNFFCEASRMFDSWHPIRDEEFTLFCKNLSEVVIQSQRQECKDWPETFRNFAKRTDDSPENGKDCRFAQNVLLRLETVHLLDLDSSSKEGRICFKHSVEKFPNKTWKHFRQDFFKDPKYPELDKYIGEGHIDNGKFVPHGMGTMIYADWSVYEGCWKNGQRQDAGFMMIDHSKSMMLNDVLPIMIIGQETVEKKRFKDALASSSPLQLTTANGRHIEAIVQDCAGQQVAYISHGVHAQCHSLYVLTWSPNYQNRQNTFASPEDICKYLFDWLAIFALHAPRAQILLVGTYEPTFWDHLSFLFDKCQSKKYPALAEKVEFFVKNEVERLNGLCHRREVDGISILDSVRVDCSVDSELKKLCVKLGSIAGDLGFMKEKVCKRWKTIRQNLKQLLARTPNVRVWSKDKVCSSLRETDPSLSAMTETELWRGLLHLASHGLVLVHRNMLFHDLSHVLNLIRPLVHHSKESLLTDDLLLPASKGLESVRLLLKNLETKFELSLELLVHLTAWQSLDADQREAMLSFLTRGSLLCNDRGKYRLNMRFSKDDAPSTSPEEPTNELPRLAEYLLPIRFIALVPKLRSIIVSLQLELFEVNIVSLPRDEGFTMTRAKSSLVLKVTDMVAACKDTSLFMTKKFGCALHVSFNDDALLHITERCIQKLFSSDMHECHRECWRLLDGVFVRKQFGIQSDAAHSLLLDATGGIHDPHQLPFSLSFPRTRRSVFLVRAKGDGCGEFIRLLKHGIENLTFSNVGYSSCESLDDIRDSIMDCGVIVLCISPRFFLNPCCLQTLHWALVLNRQQVRHVVILPVHPAATKLNRRLIIESGLLFANGSAWHLTKNVLDLLVSLKAFDDPVPSCNSLRPCMSDTLKSDWGKQTLPLQNTDRTVLLTSGNDQTGLVNRMVFGDPLFIKAAVRHSPCALSEVIFASTIASYAKIVDHHDVPDGYLDVSLYSENEFQKLLQNMALVPADDRRRNFEGKFKLVENETAITNIQGDIPIFCPVQVSSPSGFSTSGKVQLQEFNELYFMKLLDPVSRPSHRFIARHCCKIYNAVNCLRVHFVCNSLRNSIYSHAILVSSMVPSMRLDLVMKDQARYQSLTTPDKICIVRGIANAVREYHTKDLWHGSVRPDKIFLDFQKSPHLCFPGSAPCLSFLRWSSPVSAAAASAAAARAPTSLAARKSSDVWGVAVIAGSLLCDKIPFDSMSDDQIRIALNTAAAASCPPFDCLSFPHDLPDGLPDLLKQCWLSDSAQRINITDFIKVLASLFDTKSALVPYRIPPPDQDYETLPLFELLRPALNSVITDAEIQIEVKKAQNWCLMPAATDRRRFIADAKLTLLEAQSIAFYTSPNSQMYTPFTAACRSRDIALVQPWRNFAHTLQSALSKLQNPVATYPAHPQVPEFAVVYRGFDVPLTQISGEYKKGSEIFWHCMASTSTNPKTAKGFSKPKGSSHYKAGTLVKLLVKTAKSIKLLSQVPSEDEYLTSFNTKFKVLAVLPHAEALCQEEFLDTEQHTQQQLRELFHSGVDLIVLEEMEVIGI